MIQNYAHYPRFYYFLGDALTMFPREECPLFFQRLMNEAGRNVTPGWISAIIEVLNDRAEDPEDCEDPEGPETIQTFWDFSGRWAKVEERENTPFTIFQIAGVLHEVNRFIKTINRSRGPYSLEKPYKLLEDLEGYDVAIKIAYAIEYAARMTDEYYKS